VSEFVNIHYAKTHLSALLKRVREGAVITIGNAGKPVARIIPVEQASSRQPGGFSFALDDDFFAPLPAAELKAWQR
jgi:prevent-host-death family protein